MNKLTNLLVNVGRYFALHLAPILLLLALTCFVVVGYMFNAIAGTLVLGVCLLLLAYLAFPDEGR